jgi:hypothetical protein
MDHLGSLVTTPPTTLSFSLFSACFLFPSPHKTKQNKRKRERERKENNRRRFWKGFGFAFQKTAPRGEKRRGEESRPPQSKNDVKK